MDRQALAVDRQALAVDRQALAVDRQALAVDRQALADRGAITGAVAADFGDEPVAAGDEVALSGPGDGSGPAARERGEALGAVSCDIAPGTGARGPGKYRGGGR